MSAKNHVVFQVQELVEECALHRRRHKLLQIILEADADKIAQIESTISVKPTVKASETLIDETSISNKLAPVLKRKGLLTLEAIALLTKDEFLSQGNWRETSVEQVELALKEHGLSFRKG